MRLVLLILCFVLHLTLCGSESHVDITLIGGYGDLAKKYLWKALLNLYAKTLVKDDWSYSLYGAGTKNYTLGSQLLQHALEEVRCSIAENFDCQNVISEFKSKIRYQQLQSEKDYAEHCSKLSAIALQNDCQQREFCDYQSIFYLSVPPFAYKNVSSYIALHCRPASDIGLLKVVFEKPFGHNRESAIALDVSIQENLQSSEIYRVDHYLGKQVVQEILPFRTMNPNINVMLNHQNIDRIEIIMKETIDIKGRAKYYNKYGVIADVMQNHLSEILYLLAMDLPSNLTSTDEINQNKHRIIEAITNVLSRNVVIGQYADYLNHIDKELNSQPLAARSKTPTFAAVRLDLKSGFLSKGIRALMVAGKKLDERTAYARVLFNSKMFSAQSNNKCSSTSQLIFHIGHGLLGKPAILVSQDLPINTTYVPRGWHETNEFQLLSYLGQNLSCFKVFTPNFQYDAYEFLVEQVFLGRQEHFLSSSGLLESWRVWNEVVQSNDASLQIYPGGIATGKLLDFTYDGVELKFTNPIWNPNDEKRFLGGKIVRGTNFVMLLTLAEEIASAINNSTDNNEKFHIAFSGGNSPVRLFEILVAMKKRIVWSNVHIWQVDERCTLNSTLSNFDVLSSMLVDSVPELKYRNIHPMPIETSADVLCDLAGAKVYEKWLKTNIGDLPKLDYIILGMGDDGHTASLFPFHILLNETQRLVSVAYDVGTAVSKRMTITYPLIKLSKKVAIIVNGSKKCNLLQKLYQDHCSEVEKYPICKVPLISNNVTWYIDNNCNLIL